MPMSEDKSRTTFVKVLKRYEQVLGKALADDMLKDYDHGEAVIAFETLLDNLTELKADVDHATRLELRSIAADLELLDSEAGKGVYW